MPRPSRAGIAVTTAITITAPESGTTAIGQTALGRETPGGKPPHASLGPA
jgi:hypothetical protein